MMASLHTVEIGTIMVELLTGLLQLFLQRNGNTLRFRPITIEPMKSIVPVLFGVPKLLL